MQAPLRVGLVAGEASGDTLGAGFIEALRALAPDAEFFGVAGPKMRAAGCEVWEPSESLAVMGLFEILRDLPRLFRLLRDCAAPSCAARPDVFVGIDAPDTNLRLARHLHAAGIPDGAIRQSAGVGVAAEPRAAACVRPSIWCSACCRSRTASTTGRGPRAEFVGHPLADAIPARGGPARRARAAATCRRMPGSWRCCPAAGAAR